MQPQPDYQIVVQLALAFIQKAYFWSVYWTLVLLCLSSDLFYVEMGWQRRKVKINFKTMASRASSLRFLTFVDACSVSRRYFEWLCFPELLILFITCKLNLFNFRREMKNLISASMELLPPLICTWLMSVWCLVV